MRINRYFQFMFISSWELHDLPISTCDEWPCLKQFRDPCVYIKKTYRKNLKQCTTQDNCKNQILLRLLGPRCSGIRNLRGVLWVLQILMCEVQYNWNIFRTRYDKSNLKKYLNSEQKIELLKVTFKIKISKVLLKDVKMSLFSSKTHQISLGSIFLI